MNPPKWTNEEDEYIIQNYQAMTAKDVGKHLGRSTRAFYARLGELRRRGRVHFTQKSAKYTAEEIEAVRHGHGQGCKVAEVAKKIGVSIHRVEKIRKKLRLRFGADVIVRNIQEAAAIRKQQAADYAVERGWPANLRFGEILILDMLAAFQPLTRRQISERCGFSQLADHGSRYHGRISPYGKENSPRGTKKAYLPRLVEFGLVCVEKVNKPVRGGIYNRYWLTAKALEMVSQRLKRNSNGSATLTVGSAETDTCGQQDDRTSGSSSGRHDDRCDGRRHD